MWQEMSVDVDVDVNMNMCWTAEKVVIADTNPNALPMPMNFLNKIEKAVD